MDKDAHTLLLDAHKHDPQWWVEIMQVGKNAWEVRHCSRPPFSRIVCTQAYDMPAETIEEAKVVVDASYRGFNPVVRVYGREDACDLERVNSTKAPPNKR